MKINKIPKHLQLGEKKAKRIIQRKTKELRDYFRKSGFSARGGSAFGGKKGIIGLSGGLDSAVSCCLAVRALEAKNIIVVLMPYQDISDPEGVTDALKLAKNLKIPEKNILIIPINKPVDASWQALKKFKGNPPSLPPTLKLRWTRKLRRTLNFVTKSKIWTKLAQIRKGNLMARERMKILFDLSQVFKAIVIGTENRSEEELGYYTLFGDQASGIEPIKDLWKTQVYQLASFLPEIPKEILNKRPSPGLWQGQTAEKELGSSYLEADIVLSCLKDSKIKPSEIAKKFKIPKKKIDLILTRAKIGEIKKEIPYTLKS